jgi:hypothetical protein
VLLAEVPLDAVEAAPEHAKEAFNQVGRHVAASILTGPIEHTLMGGELRTDHLVEVALVGMGAARDRRRGPGCRGSCRQ